VRGPGAAPSSSTGAKLAPSIGRARRPLTSASGGTPASSRSVGITSVTCTNCRRIAPASRRRAGQDTMNDTRRPPPPVYVLNEGNGVFDTSPHPVG
jgi:hypothetical protein